MVPIFAPINIQKALIYNTSTDRGRSQYLGPQLEIIRMPSVYCIYASVGLGKHEQCIEAIKNAFWVYKLYGKYS